MGVLLIQIFHVASVGANRNAKYTVALGADLRNLGDQCLLVGLAKSLFLVVAVQVVGTLRDDALGRALEQDSVAGISFVAFDDRRHTLSFRAEFKRRNCLARLRNRVRISHRVDFLVLVAYLSAVPSELLGEDFERSFSRLPDYTEFIVSVLD